MITTIIIIIIVVAFTAYFVLFALAKNWLENKASNKRNKEKEYHLDSDYHDGHRPWHPTYKIEHCGLRVFNIPCDPEVKEIFYIENEYDEEANLFIEENFDLIKDMCASKGYTFIYLPYIRVTREMAEAMVAYRTANPKATPIDNDNFEHGLKSSFLLDYMVYPENRSKVPNGFCWYNDSTIGYHINKSTYSFDFISFDGAEARMHPKEVLDEMLPELGTLKSWNRLYFQAARIPSEGTADENFNAEMEKILLEVQEKLQTVRLKGISEAIIAQYVKPCPKLSRITIAWDFTIILNDFDNMKIYMEPIIKAVFILFLRHEKGIHFKDLPDYQTELEIIYRAIRARKNDIDEKMRSGFTPQISPNIMNLTDPCNNSINEKCTRIKEAFILRFHDSIACNYYIQGFRASEKLISIPRNLVVWEKEP